MSDEQIPQQASSPEAAQPILYPVYYDPLAVAQAHQLANQAVAANHWCAQVAIENARLHDRLAQKGQKEDAYKATFCSSGRTYTTDPNGRVVALLNHEVEQACHAIFLPPFQRCEAYVVWLSKIDQPLVINAVQFFKDARLLQTFQELPGVEIYLCQTDKKTARLMRKVICNHLERIDVPFWGGWQKDQNGKFCFLTFPNGGTHAIPDNITLQLAVNESMSAASVSVAVHNFLAAAHYDSSKPELWLLGLAFHIAALYSLLRQLGHPFPLAFGILTERAVDWDDIKRLFCWFDDGPLSLSLLPAKFSLLYRKDQPLLILDERECCFVNQNSDLLEQVLSNHQVPWKCKNEEKVFPLQALPIILSRTASALTVNPSVMILEFSSKDGKRIIGANESIQGDYLTAFVQYTTAHVDQLRGLLAEHRCQALTRSGDSLTEKCVEALGILLAIDSFIRRFYRDCGVDVRSLNEACPGTESWLLDLLEQTSDKLLDCGDLAAQFTSVARSMLMRGPLSPCPVEYEQKPSENVVFYDKTTLGFTSPAMKLICQHLGISRPVILRALAESGLLRGKPINGTTPLTRISTWDVYGVRHPERVYLLPRSAFDQFGDPLTFDGEDVS